MSAPSPLTLDLPQTVDVRLVVYDVLGRTVATLVDERLDAGSHAVAFDGSALPSGTYLVRMVSANFTATQAATLLK